MKSNHCKKGSNTPGLFHCLVLISLGIILPKNLLSQTGINTNSAINKLDVVGDTASPQKTGSALNSIVRIGANSANAVIDMGIAKDDYAWIQMRNSNDYNSNISLLLNPNGGNVGIGLLGTNMLNLPSQTLSVNGNIATTGKVKSSAAGQLQRITALTESDLPLSSNPTRFFASSSGASSEATVVSYSYTPESNSSTWIIEFDGDFIINGSRSDVFESYIYVGTTLVQTLRARFDDSNGGGGRGNSLFPIMAMYDNSSSTAQSISVRVKRISGDDYIDVSNDFTLIIKEIAR